MSQLTKALASYSHTRRVGDIVFVAGQGCRDAKTNEYRGITRSPAGTITQYDIREQTAGVLENIESALRVHNLDRSALVDVNVFLKSKSDFAAMNEVWNRFFAETTPPTRTTVFVVDLPGDNFVEMKAIAAFKS